jgi:hypothetical protein
MKKINRTVVSATLFIACLGINLAVAHERHDVISSKTALNIGVLGTFPPSVTLIATAHIARCP